MTIYSALFFLAVAGLGFFLAMSQFCMVRAVLSLKEGHLSPIRCLLAISLSIGLIVYFMNVFSEHPIYNFRSVTPKIAISGFLFGVAARFNQGCYIGSMNYLGRGHLGRIMCVLGWIVGFILVDGSSDKTSEYTKLYTIITLLGLAVLLLVAEIWSLTKKQIFIPNDDLPELKGFKAGSLMLCIGLIIGGLIYFKFPYHPSTMSLNVSAWLKGSDFNYLSLSALMMPLGMMIFHKRRGQFEILYLKQKDFKHLLWGILMAMTTTWGAGGNDGYLFEYLPKGSLHAVMGLLGMSGGILISDTLYNFMKARRKKSR
ncbi:MAG: hypothetical protein ACKOW3_02655 [Hyphomicrobium sp.]